MTFQLTILSRLESSVEKRRRDTTHLYESWFIHLQDDSYIWDITHSYDIPTEHIFPPRVFFLEKRDTTHAYTWLIHVRHDSYIWNIIYSGFQVTIFSRLDSSVSKKKTMTHHYDTWLIHARHDSYIWDMTHINETWLIQVGHDSIGENDCPWSLDVIVLSKF